MQCYEVFQNLKVFNENNLTLFLHKQNITSFALQTQVDFKGSYWTARFLLLGSSKNQSQRLNMSHVGRISCSRHFHSCAENNMLGATPTCQIFFARNEHIGIRRACICKTSGVPCPHWEINPSNSSI